MTTGNGYLFDGARNFVDIGTLEILTFSGSVSLAAWVNFDPTMAGPGDIISSYHDGVFLQVAPNPSSGGFQYTFGSVLQDGTEHSVAVDADPTDPGRWVHLVGIYVGFAYRIYRNGLLASTVQDTAGADVLYCGNWTVGQWGHKWWGDPGKPYKQVDMSMTKWRLLQAPAVSRNVMQLAGSWQMYGERGSWKRRWVNTETPLIYVPRLFGITTALRFPENETLDVEAGPKNYFGSFITSGEEISSDYRYIVDKSGPITVRQVRYSTGDSSLNYQDPKCLRKPYCGRIKRFWQVKGRDSST
eukprot:jgi/Chlat1/2514/Chrsp175S02428